MCVYVRPIYVTSFMYILCIYILVISLFCIDSISLIEKNVYLLRNNFVRTLIHVVCPPINLSLPFPFKLKRFVCPSQLGNHFKNQPIQIMYL